MDYVNKIKLIQLCQLLNIYCEFVGRGIYGCTQSYFLDSCESKYRSKEEFCVSSNLGMLWLVPVGQHLVLLTILIDCSTASINSSLWWNSNPQSPGLDSDAVNLYLVLDGQLKFMEFDYATYICIPCFLNYILQENHCKCR